jgi:hypothetical protein
LVGWLVDRLIPFLHPFACQLHRRQPHRWCRGLHPARPRECESDSSRHRQRRIRGIRSGCAACCADRAVAAITEARSSSEAVALVQASRDANGGHQSYSVILKSYSVILSHTQSYSVSRRRWRYAASGSQRVGGNGAHGMTVRGSSCPSSTVEDCPVETCSGEATDTTVLPNVFPDGK